MGLLISQCNLLAKDQQFALQGRDVSLKVNTTSLGLGSPWMEKLSELTFGEYNQIDQTTLIESSGEDA